MPGNSQVYETNPDYWDSESIDGKEFKLPYVDKITYRIIKNEATRVTALRTGKLDLMEYLRRQGAEELKKSTPTLKSSRSLSMSGTFLSMRVDQKPFDDIRVRRAMNMAVNKEEIIKAYYNRNAELFAYPQHPEYTGYFQSLSEQRPTCWSYSSTIRRRPKRFLTEAGYPNGFTFNTQVCSSNADHMDFVPLVAAYLEQVGVKMEIQPMEYAAFLSMMTPRTLAAGYFTNNGHTAPTPTIRKSFTSGQILNTSQWSDPKLDERMEAAYQGRDEFKRQAALRAMTTRRRTSGSQPPTTSPHGGLG
ncbi:ABC transporter substrate-binding protein [Bradyrhizobium cosmicum]|uniref:ABC transporter substrate-binding protein n=1 Tax=Bradyrhizobium cosmicum TaxID=1404864 RepID=UPI0028E636EB|nr:ABC transporter substrate-binding protein [Bradyrhizobium cosmicum]